MSYDEAIDWSRYRDIRGSLNLGRRIECSVALLAQMINNARGGTAKISDFAPHESMPETEDYDEVAAVMKKMGAKVRERKKK